MKLAALIGVALAGLSVGGAAEAAVITSPVGTYYAFSVQNYFGAGPISENGWTWTSTNATYQGGSVYGYNGGYGFLGNGFSSQTLTGLNDSTDAYGVTDTMTFDLATPTSAIGGVLNWVPSNAPVTIAAYDSSFNLLDTLTLSSGGANLVTPNSFYGFQESSKDIKYFTLTDGYVAVIGGLNIATVPEPSTWAMMALGFAGLGFAGYRRGRRASVAIA
jgi:hypothetical protein